MSARHASRPARSSARQVVRIAPAMIPIAASKELLPEPTSSPRSASLSAGGGPECGGPECGDASASKVIPAAPVYRLTAQSHPRAGHHLADLPPTVGQPGGPRKTCEQRVLLAALDHAAPRVIRPHNVLQLRHLIDKLQIVELDPDPARPGHPSGVPTQSVADVEHGRCPCPRSRGSLLVRRPRTSVVVHQLGCAVDLTALKEQQARGGVTQAATHGEDVAHLRARTAYRLATLTVP